MFDAVAPVLVLTVACLWLAVWALCLVLTIRFVLILLAAGVMQVRDSWKERSAEGRAG